MELYKKIDAILEKYNFSRIMLANKIGVPTATFNRYFCQEQQNKLTPYLWNILNIFPEISRDWLFFDEGEMLGEPIKKEDLQELKEKIKALEKEIAEERNINRQLTSKLLIEGTPEKDSKQIANG